MGEKVELGSVVHLHLSSELTSKIDQLCREQERDRAYIIRKLIKKALDI